MSEGVGVFWADFVVGNMFRINSELLFGSCVAEICLFLFLGLQLRCTEWVWNKIKSCRYRISIYFGSRLQVPRVIVYLSLSVGTLTVNHVKA